VATGIGWGVLLLALAGTGLYVGLLANRKVSPPIVPIASSNELPGYATGDAVLVRATTAAEIRVGDVLAAHHRGRVVVGAVRSSTQRGATTEYSLVGLGPEPITVAHTAVIGEADRKVPVVGWLLLAAERRLVQVLAGAIVVGFVALIVAGRRTPLDLLDDDEAVDPFELVHRPLALPAAPIARSVTSAADLAYVEHPMSITPDDLRQVRFAQTRKGYDTEAVDRALDTVADSIEHMLQERQQLVERLRSLEGEVERYKGMESQLGQTLAMAEQSAEQVKADAQAEAQRILTEAQATGGAGSGGGALPDTTVVELLGEMRAIRSLLQATLAPGQPPQAAPPGYPPQH
jgi:DivIVA domain-containing protein